MGRGGVKLGRLYGVGVMLGLVFGGVGAMLGLVFGAGKLGGGMGVGRGVLEGHALGVAPENVSITVVISDNVGPNVIHGLAV